MSVLVRGMDMPQSCRECSLLTVDCGCVIVGAIGEAYGKRCEWCPLVEVPTPHGDLIDRGRMIFELTACWTRPVSTAMKYIKELRTVIEAEE